MPIESSLLHQNHPLIASGNDQEFVAQFAAVFVESSQRKTKQKCQLWNVVRINVKCLPILNHSIDQRQNCVSSYHTRARCVFLCTNITQISSIAIMTNIQDDNDDNNDHDVCLLLIYSKKRFEYFDLLNHCTSNDQH